MWPGRSCQQPCFGNQRLYCNGFSMLCKEIFPFWIDRSNLWRNFRCFLGFLCQYWGLFLFFRFIFLKRFGCGWNFRFFLGKIGMWSWILWKGDRIGESLGRFGVWGLGNRNFGILKAFDPGYWINRLHC